MTEQSVQNLVKKFFRNECSPEEKQELARWIDQSAYDLTLKQSLEEAWKEHKPSESLPQTRSAEILSSILTKRAEPELTETPVRNLWIKKLAVAAIVLLTLGAGGYYLLYNQPATQQVTKIEKVRPQLLNDAYAGKESASLTLADGSKIDLDSGFNGAIASQGNTKIIGSKGKLMYDASQDKSTDVLYNSVNTARGQFYPLTLSDGTKVWLNSSSSIHFPVAFNGNDRVVDVTGEAYFEVAKNPSKPFKVRSNGGMQIEVLGTHFNINGYTDEPVVRTTLLEGSLRVTKGDAGVLLSPGQQAGLKANGKIELIKNADLDEAVSWKNGYFQFNEANLETVMRQLSRWYDVDIEFQYNSIEDTFSGQIDKNTNLSEALTTLEKSQVHTKIVGKKIVVVR